jgi:aminocarboxymuconate-semialdehyde decarboxylase
VRDAEAIDVFCHWLPEGLVGALRQHTLKAPRLLERAAAMPVMTDLDARFRLTRSFSGYRQIPSLAAPPLEQLADAETTPQLAQIANDEQAALVARHPEDFAGYVSALPMNNPDAACREAERAIGQGAAGVQVYTDVNGVPLDDPRFAPLFELMARLDRPIWIHPLRGIATPDYPGEAVSRCELWWTLGWPYETSKAMYRLVFAGVFERWPRLRIIAHHAGGMMPMMAGRLSNGLDDGAYGLRTSAEHADSLKTSLKESPDAACRRFHADTATFGSAPAIRCAVEFFGTERMLFASDMPFGPREGAALIEQTLAAVHDSGLGRILTANARRVCALDRRNG